MLLSFINRYLPARLRHWLTVLHADHRTIAASLIYLTSFVLVGRLVGAAKEVLVAFRYGLDAQLDAYLFVFNLVNWPIAVWISVSTIVLVPILTQKRNAQPSQRTTLLQAEVFGTTVLLAAVVLGFTFVVLSVVLRSGASGLPTDVAAIAETMIFPLLLYAPAGILFATAGAFLMARGRHVNTLLEAIPAAAIASALLLSQEPSISLLVRATVVGGAVQLVTSFAVLAVRKEMVLPRLSWKSDYWGLIAVACAVTTLGQALISATSVVDQFFAARLDSGAIATLNYANRIVALILSLGALTISRATLPVFARAGLDDLTHVVRLAKKWAGLLLIAGIVLAAVAAVLAPLIVRMLFERGAFTEHDTQVVASALRFSLPQVPVYFAGIVFVSVLASRRQFVAIASIAAILLVTKLIANAVLAPSMGVNGLALATSAMYAVSLLVHWIVVSRHAGQVAADDSPGSAE